MRHDESEARRHFCSLVSVMACIVALQPGCATAAMAAKCIDAASSNAACNADTDCCAGLVCNKKSRCQVGCKRR
jgi:hypothetical protein